VVWVVVTSAPAWADGLEVALGKALFERTWVPAPASTRSADGLGPLFNARSCAACHPRGGGAADGQGLVLKLGGRHGSGDPAYGRQLQTRAAQPFPAEGVVRGANPADLAFGPLDGASGVSPRLAPPLLGLGLLEQVPEAAILKGEDPDDADGDGISGRAHRVGTQGDAVGRFGLKATAAGIADQAADAFLLDLGLSTLRRPEPWGDCTIGEADCRAAPHGAATGEPEVTPEMLELVAAYVRALPAPPLPAPAGAGGKAFIDAGCGACHRPALPLADGGEVAAFTDLLLHDLGEDDGVGEGDAAPGEWRTAPLWGLGRRLAAGRGLMHDGAAATVEAAIARHGGEAAAARGAASGLDPGARRALLEFLGSL
jgi:CxxC motif-containing protein (DUF1111 family)